MPTALFFTIKPGMPYLCIVSFICIEHRYINLDTLNHQAILPYGITTE